MSNNWVGFMVSVSLKDGLGTYQGQISAVTGTSMTLIKAFHNGVPYREPEVSLNSTDIEDLKLIDTQPNTNSANGQSTITVAKPVPKRAGRSISMSESTSNKTVNNSLQNHSKSKPIDIESKTFNNSNTNNSNTSNMNDYSYKNGTPNKKDKFNKMKWKDEACFGTSIDQSMAQDFDFEKNLALFNKQAIWEQLNASQKPDVVHQTDNCGRQVQKYRHDENVITPLPTAFRQIIVPAPDTREYITDDDLVIPSVTQELRRQLFAAAERRGLNLDRQVELMGRAATEMALQLLGGGHRLNPHNTHQWPNVVVLCGPHRQGAVGLNCARHLASHGVNTMVYTALPDPEGALKTEFSLYKLTKNKMTTSIAGLPHTADLIVLALCDDSDNPTPYTQLAEWTNQNRAPVLALDPPAVGTPGILTKFSLVPVLPLSHSSDNGKLYLCNLGFPQKVFKDIGIKYCSPFGPKFVIPLHPNDT